jgi:hypothetical protein
MAEEKSRQDEVFTLRLWLEDASARARWRAVVTHVNSGERCVVANYGDLCEFLERKGSAPG